MKINPFLRLLLILLLGGGASSLRATDTVCAQVSIQIIQKLTLERTGFEATLQVANGMTTGTLTNFNVELLFTDTNGMSVSNTVDVSNTTSAFWYRVQTGYPTPDGTPSSVIPGGTTQTYKWLIVPAAGTSQGAPQGTQYFIGANVTYQLNGVTQTMQVSPDYVMVYPSPILQLEYFLPEQVLGDDPGTASVIEPPVPFSLGVRV